jgi:hypothetical protein
MSFSKSENLIFARVDVSKIDSRILAVFRFKSEMIAKCAISVKLSGQAHHKIREKFLNFCHKSKSRGVYTLDKGNYPEKPLVEMQL